MRTDMIKELLQQEAEQDVLLLCSACELQQLEAALNIRLTDTSLSMQHMQQAALAAGRLHKTLCGTQLLVVTPEADTVTLAERALIYALLVRCRKVISCRDKLEDMLKFDQRQEWAACKAVYETKVLDLYKATWRDELVYPYNIVDNIKEYNKNESYILKQLYWHLAERVPGKVNAGDMAMMRQLRQMFADLSLSLLKPQLVLAGDVGEEGQLPAVLKTLKEQAQVIDIR